MCSFDLDIANSSITPHWVRPQSLKPGPCPLDVPDYPDESLGTQLSKLRNQVSDNCPEAHCPEVQWLP